MLSLQPNTLPLYRIPTAEMRDQQLIFLEEEGFDRAIQAGFFQLKIPESMQEEIRLADEFVNLFYLPKENDFVPYNQFRGFKELGQLGFHGYKVDSYNQVERFDLEQKEWGLFPEEIRSVAQKMNALGIQILTNVLKQLEIPERHWVDLTGGSIENQGLHVSMWNHFRHCVQARGLKNHKDWGNVTVLRSQFPGLEAKIDGQWRRVTPSGSDYFIVNFGIAMETSTSRTSRPVTASEHRVIQQVQIDRVSYALFVDNDRDIRYYDPESDETVIVYPNMAEFTAAASKLTYEG